MRACVRTDLECCRIRDGYWEICKDCEEFVGCNTAKGEVVSYFMDCKEEIVVGGPANSIGQENE